MSEPDEKLLTALGAAAVIATMTMPVSAEKLWKYSETVTIDLAEARYKPTTDGHDILEFVAVEQLPDGTCTYTYVYDRTAGTIQVKEMERPQRNSIIRATSPRPPSTPPIPLSVNAHRWQKRSTREKYIRSKPWTPFMKK